MKLDKIKLENFKGLKSETIDFADETTILGMNGTGKTTIKDAFLWLIGGVDSTGRVASGKGGFAIRPHGADRNAIEGLITSVEALIDVEGIDTILKKEHHEKKLKGKVTGFETFCFIDEVPKQVNEYEDYIEAIIEKSKFRMLADLYYFCSDNMHWSDRRNILLEITGDTGNPEGFDDLIEKMGNRSVDDYKKVVTTERKGYKKEADETTPRIDELQTSLDDYKVEDTKTLEKDRDVMVSCIADLKADRNVIAMREGDRQTLIDEKNELESQKIKRESELKNDTSNIRKYVEEKTKIEVAIHTLKGKCTAFSSMSIPAKQTQIKHADDKRDAAVKHRNEIRDEYNRVLKDAGPDTCALCSQSLPDVMRDDYQNKQNKKLDALEIQGREAKAEIEESKDSIQTLNDALATMQNNLDKASIELEEAEEVRDERFEKLDALIAADVKVKPDEDPTWCGFGDEITDINTKIGDPVTQQLENIDSKVHDGNIALTEINESLANHDNATKTQKRIKELTARETQLGQLITELDGILEQIQDFKMKQNELIESSVNKFFKHVTFRLFTHTLKGEPVDDCTAIYRKSGTQYPDCSTGEKIIMGNDITEVLAKFYGVSIPKFIDNAESLTLPIESDSQIIRLVADKKVKKLKVKE